MNWIVEDINYCTARETSNQAMWGHVEEEKHATLEAEEKRRQKLYRKLKTLSIWLDRPGPFLSAPPVPASQLNPTRTVRNSVQKPPTLCIVTRCRGQNTAGRCQRFLMEIRPGDKGRGEIVKRKKIFHRISSHRSSCMHGAVHQVHRLAWRLMHPMALLAHAACWHPANLRVD